MQIMVTRKDINGTVYGAVQAVSREEALRLYTSSGGALCVRRTQERIDRARQAG